MDSSTDNDVSCIHFPFFISELFSLSSGRGGYLLTRINPQVLVSPARKGMTFVLAIFWLMGIFCGVMCFPVASIDVFYSLMRSSVVGSVSIVHLLITAFLPFLLSASALLLDCQGMLLGTCFCKAFLFSFVSLGTLLSFPSGGWLFRYFLMFGDCAMLPLLLWFWLHSIAAPLHSRWIMTGVLGCVFAFAAVLNYRIIAPCFACLIDSMKG